jgi:hypothetical protein
MNVFSQLFIILNHHLVASYARGIQQNNIAKDSLQITLFGIQLLPG